MRASTVKAIAAKAARQYSVAEVAALAKSLYAHGAWLRRKTQQLRPYSCPVEVLLSIFPESGTVLDVGCGSGLFLGLALASGKTIVATGVDISEPALRLAMEMRQAGLDAAQRARLTFHHVRSTADWPSRTFDMVSLIDVMHHVPPAQRAELLAAVADHVRPGGILLYKDMVQRPRWRAFFNWLHDLAIARDWIRYQPIAQIDAAAKRARFVEVRAETINCLWYGHEMRVYRKKLAP